MEKHCAVITAYKNPQNLKALIDAIHDEFVCYVHIDLRSKDLFKNLVREYPDVHFYSKYLVNWGGYEHLLSVIDLLKLSLSEEWSYVHILSGEDFPVKKPISIIKELEGKTNSFLGATYVDKENHLYSRWYRYYWPYVHFHKNYKRKPVRITNLAFVAFQSIFPFYKRRLGEYSRIYTAYLWSSYSRIHLEYILNYIDLHPSFMKALHWCKVPEEFCFPTIIMNSKYSSEVTLNNKRYWNMRTGNGWGPGILTMKDLSQLQNSDVFFCRKVEQDTEVARYLWTRIK